MMIKGQEIEHIAFGNSFTDMIISQTRNSIT